MFPRRDRTTVLSPSLMFPDDVRARFSAVKTSTAWRALVVLMLIVPLSGCFAFLAARPAQPSGIETESTGAAGSPLPTPLPTSSSTVTVPAEALAAEHDPDEPLLGSLSSARGTAEFTIEPSSTGRVAIYVRCAGDGEINVRVGAFAGVTQQCTPETDPAPIREVLAHDGLRADGPLTVSATAADARIWAVAVTELPAP